MPSSRADCDRAALDLVVAGGGIAGLCAAWRARQRDPAARVVVLEAGPRPGGVVASERIDGFLVERAASSLRAGAESLHRLIEELGLGDELVAASGAAARRFVLHRGRLVAAPASIAAMATTPLLTTRAKLRLLAEPWIGRRDGGDETIAEFVARRCGAGVVSPLIDAVVTGIFAGDPARLEARSAFPRLVEMEARHGSLARALLAARREARRRREAGAPRRPPLAALRGGMGRLAERLAERLGDSIRCDARVVALARDASGAWRIELATRERLLARELVLATPSHHSARLLAAVDGALARDLDAIESAPVAVVAIGLARAQVGADVDALGFLVPAREHESLLGVLFESSLFPDRAPAGHVLLRAMVGGDRSPLPDDPRAVADLAWRAIAPLLHLRGPPRLLESRLHRPGIPQYRPGHAARLARIAARLAALPGLALAGWSYRGIALDDQARGDPQ